MRKLVFLGLTLLALSACTPADQSYCQSYGVTGAEFNKCIDYYHAQEAAFRADRYACEAEADVTYPPTLYDRGHYEHIVGGFGPPGTMYGGSTVFVEPDHYHNRQLDRLRMRIIEPCMQAKGWNSGSDWQAGSHPVTLAPKPKTLGAPKAVPAASGLPWLQ